MSNAIAVLGAGGFAREMYWHIKGADASMQVIFVDDATDTREIRIDGRVVPVIKDWCFDRIAIDGPGGPTIACERFVLGTGSPQSKKALVQKALSCGLCPAPTIIHPRALIQDRDCKIGVGGVITPGCVITTHVTVGDYVLLNLNVTVGHDSEIGDYVTCNPGCHVSGNVIMEDGVSLGTGTVVREKTKIAADVVTGAQACVVRDITEPGVTVVGLPAKKLG